MARLQTRSMTRPINSFEQSQLDKLYQELDKYTCLVEAEKAKAASMEKDVVTLRDEIWKRHKQMGGINAAANNTRLLEKQSRMLESRLDQTLVKFNKCVSRNKMLRKEIDGLRGDRVTYEKVYKKLENVRCVLQAAWISLCSIPFFCCSTISHSHLYLAGLERANEANGVSH